MKNNLEQSLVVITVLAADLGLKAWVFSSDLAQTWIIGFFPYENYGFAFGLPVLSHLVLPLGIAALSIFFIYTTLKWKNMSKRAQLACLLIITGGLLNIIERIVLGYVRDPIKIFYGYWNIADFAVIIGIGTLILESRKLKKMPEDDSLK